jgi:hypothetical protein
MYLGWFPDWEAEQVHRSVAQVKGRAAVHHWGVVLSLRSKSMNEPMQLSLEQQFNLRSFETQVDKMSREQAQQFLVKLYEQMMMRESMYKHFLKHEWGIGPNPQI